MNLRLNWLDPSDGEWLPRPAEIFRAQADGRGKGEYLAAEPIRKALAKCELGMVDLMPSQNYRVELDKSDYEALKEAINGK